MSDAVKKYFCPRLLDYVIFVGPRPCTRSGNLSPHLGNNSRVPHLLRRYPPQDHSDFALPPDVVIFCQPEGCDRINSTLGAYNNPSQTTNSFVFLLTEKDTSRVRYGVCLNFYRPLQASPEANPHDINTEDLDSNNNEQAVKKSQQQIQQENWDNELQSKLATCSTSRPNGKSNTITYALNSICIISHHPFLSTFRECLFILKKFIQVCDERNLNTPDSSRSNKQTSCICRTSRSKGHISRNSSLVHQPNHHQTTGINHVPNCIYRNPVWNLLTMPNLDGDIMLDTALCDVGEIDGWILRLLSLPVPIPQKTKVEVSISFDSLQSKTYYNNII